MCSAIVFIDLSKPTDILLLSASLGQSERCDQPPWKDLRINVGGDGGATTLSIE